MVINIYIKNIVCNGANRAMHIQGLPEMPVNEITLENSILKAKQGINCIYGSKINFKNIQVITEERIPLTLINSSVIDITGFSSNNDKLIRIIGSGTKEIVIHTNNKEELLNQIIIDKKVPTDKIIVIQN